VIDHIDPTRAVSPQTVKSKPGPPMTLGAAAAFVRLIVWCKACGPQVEPRSRRNGPVMRRGGSYCLIGGSGSRTGSGSDLIQNRFQRHDARRQRIAVIRDDPVEFADQGGFLIIG
jgi:hypothetical protein